MTFRDTILSDHEWSEEDDDEIDLIDEDFDHDEMDLTDPLDQPVIPLPIQPAFRVRIEYFTFSSLFNRIVFKILD